MTPGRTRRRPDGDPLETLLQALRALEHAGTNARDSLRSARSSPVHARLARTAILDLRSALVEAVRCSGEALRVLGRISQNAEGGR